MHADRRVQLGIARAQHRRRRPPGGQPGDVHPCRVDGVLRHDLAGDAGDQGGLALAATLLGRLEPAPAARRVGRGDLLRPDDQAAPCLGGLVHPRAQREIRGRLAAAVQHHHQRRRPAVVRRRNIQPVRPRRPLRRTGQRQPRHPCKRRPREAAEPARRHTALATASRPRVRRGGSQGEGARQEPRPPGGACRTGRRRDAVPATRRSGDVRLIATPAHGVGGRPGTCPTVVGEGGSLAAGLPPRLRDSLDHDALPTARGGAGGCQAAQKAGGLGQPAGAGQPGGLGDTVGKLRHGVAPVGPRLSPGPGEVSPGGCAGRRLRPATTPARCTGRNAAGPRGGALSASGRRGRRGPRGWRAARRAR